jgi:hypothetical protein
MVLHVEAMAAATVSCLGLLTGGSESLMCEARFGGFSSSRHDCSIGKSLQ